MRASALLFGLWLTELAVAPCCRACIWDSDTLSDEKKKSPEMAALILGAHRQVVDTNALLKRIELLKAKPREDDPAWLNDFAGAYLRLGHAQEAANLLEPVVSRFPDDYGVHANLGTAYHLLRRYAEAEREIARDLELKPDAHFGLEIYHLALLQYLSRDKEYQMNHVYVDEFTPLFLEERISHFSAPDDLATESFAPPEEIAELKRALANVSATNSYERTKILIQLASLDPPPAYRFKWNLAHHPNFDMGVRYMGELNQTQPACFVMLGIACLKKRDLNLAALAFERAIKMGSPQREILERHIAEIREHIAEARWYRPSWRAALIIGGVILALGIIAGMRFLSRLARG